MHIGSRLAEFDVLPAAAHYGARPMVTAADIGEATARLTAVLCTAADMARPSRLPGWTVGHVVAHVALNAEAFERVAAERRAGRLGA